VNASRLDKWIKLAAAGFLLIAGAGSAAAQTKPAAGFETKARQAILMDADENLVLFEKDADRLAPPASMSNLMTSSKSASMPGAPAARPPARRRCSPRSTPW
jgi:D-alanyl-D-alanine carboxypeptidase